MAGMLGNNGGRFYAFASQPVLIDCSFVVDAANLNGLGVRDLRGQGVANVFMNTSAPPGVGANGLLNPNPLPGYALIQLSNNYNRYLGEFSGAAAPTTGLSLNIDALSAALVVGTPYIIESVGLGPLGTATINPVADVAGSLAGKYFELFDSYGNTFVIWFSVSGAGSPPLLGPAALPGQRGLKYVQQSILLNDTAATIGAALVLTIQNLPSGIAGVMSFTATGATPITVVSTLNAPLASIPRDGSTAIPEQGPAVPIAFTVVAANATAGAIYTDGSGHLYTVTTTLVAGVTLLTMGVGTPIGGILTLVSGTGDASIPYSAVVANLFTGFAFALTVSDTNLADWQAVGLPKGLIPTVGQSFIATSTGAGGSTGTVLAAGVGGIISMEVVGDPNASLAPMPQGGSPHVGGWIMVQIIGGLAVPTAPADGVLMRVCFVVDAKFSPSNVGL